jgi:hypothetical protein
MPTLSTTHRNRLQSVTSEAREAATTVCKAALENLAVHEADYRPHMTVEQRKLRNRLRARGKAVGDERDVRSGRQEIKRLAEDAAYEHWHRLLFTRFLAENHLLITDHANGNVPVTLEECEELSSELGAKDGFELACRFASTTLPAVFRSDDPVLELSFPANDRKKLRELLDSFPQEIFTASDSLGWTYQFWQTKRKKEVNDSGVKIGADELAPVTQLFTEDYMVDFLLDNTLGAWHAGKTLAANPNLATAAQSEDELRQAMSLPGCPWKYLRFIRNMDGQWAPAAGTFDGWPKTARELKCLDPCMGSGHFVVAMFERLVALRMEEEKKLDPQAAVAAVISDNLYGLELDPRCTQIAAFNLALAAWRRVEQYCILPPMNLACSGLAPNSREADWVALAGDNHKLQRGIERLYRLFEKAAVLGSLINPRAVQGDLLEASFHDLQPLLEKALAGEGEDESAHEMAVTARGLAKAAEILAGEFTLIATNVPYLLLKKQTPELKDFSEQNTPDAKMDLATVFLRRCFDYCGIGGAVAAVTPQNWLFLQSYRDLRFSLFKTTTWRWIARLGPKGFQTPMWDFNVLLSIFSTDLPSRAHIIPVLDVSGQNDPYTKASSLIASPVGQTQQEGQVQNPDGRFTFEDGGASALLAAHSDCYAGIQNGDSPRFQRSFWENAAHGDLWHFQLGTVGETIPHGGREMIIYYDRENGHLREEADIRREKLHDSDQRGNKAWGKLGVIVSQMNELKCSLYTGELYDQSCAVVVPHAESMTPAVWAFCSSPDFYTSVRRIDQALKVTNATLVKVPFDLAHWQKVAAEKYPLGLPKPFSNDPTQWLFNGHPAGADEPLHVAVARLLGYQWPRQTGSSFPDCSALGADGLEKLADDDGIVCLAPLNREQPAAQRLRALLTAALGKFDERDLIRNSGPKSSTKTSLEEWLRDDFFAQHCALFHSRPFIWHIWDGLKDGFHALVHYHRLDHAKLKTLSYTYLGDWIRDQKAAAEADTPGAAERLGAAKKLQAKLVAILEGEAPLDIFVRWKPLHQQAIGWHPDLNDGVRLNIRPFLLAGDVGAKGAGILRAKPGIDANPKPDRGSEPTRDKAQYPWFWCAEDPGTDPVGGRDFVGCRSNTTHLTLACKQAGRKGKR